MSWMLRVFSRMPTSWIRAASALRGRSRWLKRATDWLPALLRRREGRIQRGPGRGLRFNGGPSAVGFVLGTHDPEVQHALERLLQPGQVAYDIGANVGFTALIAARQVGAAGRVVCFEPLAANAEMIRHNAQLNDFGQIDVRYLALGAQDGEADFQTSATPTWGRLAQSGAAPCASGMIRVPVRSLDSVLAAGEVPSPAFIKMDVEGAEPDVLRGGRLMLANARPALVIELHHTYEAVRDALDGLEYELLPLTPDAGGEFQVLAFPRERHDLEAVCTELAYGQAVPA